MNMLYQNFGLTGLLVAWIISVAFALAIITSLRRALSRRAHHKAAQAAIQRASKKLQRAKAFAKERYGMSAAIEEADEHLGRAKAMLGLNNHLVFLSCSKAESTLNRARRAA